MCKNHKIRNKCIVLCTLIIYLGLCITILKYVVSKILVEKIHMDNYFTRIVVDDDALFKGKMQDQDKDNSKKNIIGANYTLLSKIWRMLLMK